MTDGPTASPGETTTSVSQATILPFLRQQTTHLDRGASATVAERIALATAAPPMKPRERAIYHFVLVQCYLIPARQGHRKVRRIAWSPTRIGAALGMDVSNTSKAIRALIEGGWLHVRDGTLAPVAARFRAEADRIATDWVDGRIDHDEDLPGRDDRDGGRIDRDGPAPVGPVDHADGRFDHDSVTCAPVVEPARAPASEVFSGAEDSSMKLSLSTMASDARPREGREREIINAPIQPGEVRKASFSPEEVDWIERTLARVRSRSQWQAYNLVVQLAGPVEWYTFPRVRKAVKRAVLRERPNWSYVKSILDQWGEMGKVDPGPEDRYDDEMVLQAEAVPTGLPTAAPGPPVEYYQARPGYVPLRAHDKGA